MTWIQSYKSPNYGPRVSEDGNEPEINMLVLHYTGMSNNSLTLEYLCNPLSRVSAHFLLDEKGNTYQLVATENRAWHAGISSWRGVKDVNSHSIGIELSNPGHDFGYKTFPEPQIDALKRLSKELINTYPISPRNVIGHSDVAPGRKIDPGEFFPWEHFASEKIGIWPEPHVIKRKAYKNEIISKMLSSYGYDTKNNSLKDVLSAFQRHFRPRCFDGIVDNETIVILKRLLKSVADD